MKPKVSTRTLSLLLCALLLSACAVNLRPSDPFSDAEPVPALGEPEQEGEQPPEEQRDQTQEQQEQTPEPAPAAETEPDGEDASETESRTEPDLPAPDLPEADLPEADPPEEDPEAAEEEVEEESPEQDPAESPEPDPAPADGEREARTDPWTFGTRAGDVWRNDAAGLRFVLPGDDWVFAGEEELAASNEGLPEGTLYDMQAVSEAGSSVLVMARRIPDPEAGEESVTLAEYAGILSDGMKESGGDEAEIVCGEPETAEFAGAEWLRADYLLTWFGAYESRSTWFTREENGWFLTLAVTASPADWLDADGILSMITSPDAPVPEKPVKPAPEPEPPRFKWGSDSLENGLYRNDFAGITVRAADGWTFMTEKELAKRNDLHVPKEADSETIAEAEDRENVRCVMHLENGDGAVMELSFIRLDAFGAEGNWEQYASFLAESLIESGEKAGFSMSATDGEWAQMAGERWFVRIVTFSSGGYAVGQQMLLWRPVGGELAEMTLDNGVWTDLPLSDLLAMIGKAE